MDNRIHLWASAGCGAAGILMLYVNFAFGALLPAQGIVINPGDECVARRTEAFARPQRTFPPAGPWTGAVAAVPRHGSGGVDGTSPSTGGRVLLATGDITLMEGLPRARLLAGDADALTVRNTLGIGATQPDTRLFTRREFILAATALALTVTALMLRGRRGRRPSGLHFPKRNR